MRVQDEERLLPGQTSEILECRSMGSTTTGTPLLQTTSSRLNTHHANDPVGGTEIRRLAMARQPDQGKLGAMFRTWGEARESVRGHMNPGARVYRTAFCGS